MDIGFIMLVIMGLCLVTICVAATAALLCLMYNEMKEIVYENKKS